MNEVPTINCGSATTKDNTSLSHTPSNIQVDTLFTFVSKPEYLFPYIENSCIVPRYCDEDIRYLHIDGLERIYIPMKCFCDINLHKLSHHLDFYGRYGLAFSKEWGMNKGIQPVQYINTNSNLCRDFSEAFSKIFKSDFSKETELEALMKSYMLHELMYYKPYEGQILNRVTKKMQQKCFTEECEWRFIPDLSGTDYPQIFYDKQIANAGVMNDISKSLTRIPSVALKYNYDELKYIIIETVDDFIQLMGVIDKLCISVHTRNELISKVIIWDKSRGDF